MAFCRISFEDAGGADIEFPEYEGDADVEEEVTFADQGSHTYFFLHGSGTAVIVSAWSMSASICLYIYLQIRMWDARLSSLRTRCAGRAHGITAQGAHDAEKRVNK